MTNPRLAIFAFAGIVSLAQGCVARTCHLVGWNEGLTVQVTSAQPLTGGSYRFVIAIPGETFDVPLTLEAPKNTQQGIYVSEYVTRGSWQVNASLSGSTQYGTLGEVVISRGADSGGPASLTLTVLQNDVQIGALELAAIDYSQREPNGPGCGVATTATASVAIAPVQ